MNAQAETARPALRLVVNNDAPHLSKPDGDLHAATNDGEVVDPYWAKVIALADHLKSEHTRITTENPMEGLTVKVNLLPGCTADQIDHAFKMLQEQGWDILPAALYSTESIYLRNYQC